MTRNTPKTQGHALLALAASLLCTVAVAQPSRETRATQPKELVPDNTAREPVTFQTEPLSIPLLGLTIPLATGAEAQADSMGANTAATIKGPNGEWLIKIQTPRTGNKELTLKALVDQALAALVESNSVQGDNSTYTKTLSREPAEGRTLEIRNDGSAMPIERFYVELPRRTHEPFIRGFTAARLGQDQFITFELFTTRPYYERAREIYELTVGGSRFRDVTEARVQRAALASAGLAFLKQLSRADIESLINDQPERWDRLFKPAKTGSREDDQEVGYRRVRLSTGREAGASRDGYVVRIDARLLQDNTIIDSQSFYHMTFDRREENWSVRMTVRGEQDSRDAKTGKRKHQQQSTTHSEVGVRHESQMQVRVEGTGQAPRLIEPQIAGEGYISRVESALLPQLLVRKQIGAACGLYAYQTQAERITMRRDEVFPPDDETGTWRVVTRLAEDMPDNASTFTSRGELVEAEMGNGIKARPIQLKELHDLWKRKGLPLD